MIVYHFFNLFLYFETLVLILVFILIVLRRVRDFFYRINREKHREEISRYVAEAIKKKPLPFKKMPVSLYMEVLEEYDRRLKGSEWNELKFELCKQLLLPKARRWANSPFWIRRNFSARVFALAPQLTDEPYILPLVDDRFFLVRSIASAASIRMESEKGVIKTLEHMQKETGYAKYYYADLTSQGTNQVFLWVSELAQKRADLHLSCLQVLAVKTAPVPTPFLEADLHSSDREIRKAALKVAKINPQKAAWTLFRDCLLDVDPQIRVLGAEGLANYPQQEGLLTLQKGLSDSDWSVRLACGESLKRLNKLDLIEDRELFSYVSEFG